MNAVRRFVTIEQRTRAVLSCVAIFILTLTILLIGIALPAKPYFDEVHYVPAAREILKGDFATNTEHPPLAKQLIAASIAVFGDNPFGWRLMSAVFGAFAAVGIYLWALALFEDEGAAWWSTGVTLANQVLYVQSRIAMLDIFMAAFLLWALAAFSATWLPSMRARTKSLLTATGVLLGLAGACKWVGVLAWLGIAGTVAAVKILQRLKTKFGKPADTDWYRPDLWQDVTLGGWSWYLVVLPFAAYYLCFLPFGLSALLPNHFVPAQIAMWQLNSMVGGTHPYMSSWTDWPTIARPIWYYFDALKWDTGEASARAVVFLGNPLVLWSGVVAIAACLYGALEHRRKDAFLISVAYCVLYFSWAIIPRKLEFAFYYLPAALALGPALAYLFYRTPLNRWPWARRAFLAASILLFVYFLPVSSAAVTASQPQFNQLMWFANWR